MQLWQREKWKAEVTIVTQRDETIESLQQDKESITTELNLASKMLLKRALMGSKSRL